MEKAKIQFKPLHEGMGFHPFSDGLPYAPESKTKYATPSTGTGAVSAGRPRFATQGFSTQNIPSKPMGTARQLQQAQQQAQQQIQQPIPPQKVQPQQPFAAPQAQRAAPKAAMTMAPAISILRRRGFAYLMDTVIHAGFWLTVNLTALFLFKFQLDSEIVKDHFGQFLIFFCVSQWMFIALQEMLFDNSIGKVFFNLEFKRNHRSLLLRSIVFMLGVAAFGSGLIFRPQDRLGQIQLKSQLYSS